LVTSTMAAAQSIELVPFEKMLDTVRPFEPLRILHVFGEAKAPAGEVAVFRAKGPVYLNMYRPAYQIAEGADVKITAKRLDGSVIVTWEQLGKLLNHPAVQRKVDVPGNQEFNLEVSVVDHAAGGPTGRPPYTVLMEIWPTQGAGSAKLIAGKSILDKPFPPESCTLVSKFSREERHTEKAGAIRLQGTPVGVPTSRLVTAGSMLALKIPADLTNLASAKVSLYVKNRGDRPFIRVCNEISIPKGSGSRLLEVSASRFGEDSVWRIELTTGSPFTSTASIEFFRYKNIGGIPPWKGEVWNASSGYMCLDRMTQNVAYPRTRNAFAGRGRLDVEVGQAVPAYSEDQKNALDALILNAVSIWVRACLVCRVDNLSVVTINGDSYVHPALYMMVRTAERSANPINLPLPRVQDTVASTLASSRIGIATPFEPYYKVSLEKDFAHICALKIDNSLPVMRDIQENICKAPKQGAAAGFLVQFVDGKTACGDNDNIIACRADHELTEYNVRDFRFSLPYDIAPPIGRGPIQVDLMHSLLHEMGHWIGLPHVSSDDSIMAESLEKSRCIDRQTILSLVDQVVETKSKLKPMPFLLRASPALK
jgi:hypothetical protein